MSLTVVVNGTNFSAVSVGTHWEGFGQVRATSLPYSLKLSKHEFKQRYDRPWRELIARESADDGTASTGLWSELQQAGFPSLEEMLNDHPALLAALAVSLGYEFVGWLVEDVRKLASPSCYLVSIQTLRIEEADLTVTGQCELIGLGRRSRRVTEPS